MLHFCLCDSIQNAMSAKHGSWVVGKNAFSQLVCKKFWFLIHWKLFENPCNLWLVILNLFPANVILK